MARSIIFWILAIFITLSSAMYQRATGPTYPVDGQAEIDDVTVFYTLTRSHGGAGDQPVYIRTERDGMVNGSIMYRRYKTSDDWTRLPLEVRGDSLIGWLPHQPPAGKLEYFLELDSGDELLRIPDHETVVTRFKGAVPSGVLIPHVIFMFLAMLFSTRTGIEALRPHGRPRLFVFITTGLLVVGGLILGPIVQKFAFGEYWTGFPFGTDLTDNKTLIAFIAWLLAILAVWNKSTLAEHPGRRWVVLGASVVMLLVYLIPHSMMGSELDYNELDRQRRMQQQGAPAIQTDSAMHGAPEAQAVSPSQNGSAAPRRQVETDNSLMP